MSPMNNVWGPENVAPSSECLPLCMCFQGDLAYLCAKFMIITTGSQDDAWT